MPSLTYIQTELAGNRTAKINFSRSQECRQCISSLTEPGDKARALGLLALASRDAEAAANLRKMVSIKVLEGLAADYKTAVLRLVAALGTFPTEPILETIAGVLNLESPRSDDIAASQFACQILRENNLSVKCTPNLRAPELFLAAQIMAAEESLVDPELLWKFMRPSNKQLRLAIAWKLTRTTPFKKSDILPYVVELIPDADACDVAAAVVSRDSTGARELFQHSNFNKLLASPVDVTPQVLGLCAAMAQTDDLRMALMSQGALSIIFSRRDLPSLALLRALSRSVKCLRSGAGTPEVARMLFECLEKGVDIDLRAQAMAVACNLVIDTSPVSDLVLGHVRGVALEGLSSSHREMQLNSMWFLRNAIFNKSLASAKKDLLGDIGVLKLLDLCDCKDPDVENAALGFLRNYLAFNDEGVELWISMYSTELWALIERKLRSGDSVLNTLYILVHIAASTPAHQQAILKRPIILNRVATVLDGTEDEDVLVAGVWFLCNLYQKGGNPSRIDLFRGSLKRCLKYHITIRIKAEALLEKFSENKK